ncbi:metal-sensitive transcriptional regulator [Methylophilaceae bacterium]|jgi:DNA-binding FrmR family transcriptional regulator|nr:metal-sensitive transcriptional regulator [Methylophilaceae bacterium]|tara:strand:- start:878 stop:1162 length:285 start_codon:yes stop_codon:yes gene_type:complete
MKNTCESKHPNYEKHLPRINKVVGQLNGIKKMIEDKRYCPEIITQLKAVSSACQSLEIIMLQKHLETCVMEAFHSTDKIIKNKKIQELTNLYKR